jgi:hypothetical protein
MKIRNYGCLLSLLFLLPLYTSAQSSVMRGGNGNSNQSKPSAEEDYAARLLRNNALNLLNEAGEKAANLSKPNQRIEIRLQIAKVQWDFEPETALKFLESAWRETFTETENERGKNQLNSLRKQILSFAAKVAPAKADNWIKEIKAEESDTKENQPDKKTPILTERQKADAILESSIVNLDANPGQSLSIALSSLSQTGKISHGFNKLVEMLRAKNRSDHLRTLYAGISDYASNRTSADPQDLLAVINLLLDSAADINHRNKLFNFLINSARQITVNQISDGISTKPSADEMLTIYRNFALHLKPFLQNNPEMMQNVPLLDSVIRELAKFISDENLQNPLLNPNPIEIQIEKAKKIAGSGERDAQLSKIISYLLSRRLRNEKNSLRYAQEIADEISDSEARRKFNDFIQIVKIEQLLAVKNTGEAEKQARKISTNEIRSWVMMALGKLQSENPFASLELFDESFASLRKSGPSNYKTQLALLLASLYLKADKNKASDVFAEAVKYSTQSEDSQEKDARKKDAELQIIFFSNIAGLEFDAAEFAVKKDFIELPAVLSQLAVEKWNETYNASQQLQPLYLRCRFQIQMANVVLRQSRNNKTEPKQ